MSHKLHKVLFIHRFERMALILVPEQKLEYNNHNFK